MIKVAKQMYFTLNLLIGQGLRFSVSSVPCLGYNKNKSLLSVFMKYHAVDQKLIPLLVNIGGREEKVLTRYLRLRFRTQQENHVNLDKAITYRLLAYS